MSVVRGASCKLCAYNFYHRSPVRPTHFNLLLASQAFVRNQRDAHLRICKPNSLMADTLPPR